MIYALFALQLGFNIVFLWAIFLLRGKLNRLSTKSERQNKIIKRLLSEMGRKERVGNERNNL